jgi:hypothetical protein
MSNPEYASLKAAIANGTDLQSALSAFLKKEVPVPTSQFLKEQPYERKCGEGVNAEECKAIIDQCLSGDKRDQNNCKAVLADLVNDPSRQKVLADGIKGMDGRMARSVCKTLGINFDLPNAVDVWMGNLNTQNSSAATAIKDNSPLMDIIRSFAVAAANPALNTKSLAFSRAKAAMSVLPIPVRTPRTYEHKSDSGFLIGGGRNVKLVANTYEQYTDSLKRLASMSGGGAELNRTHDEIANIYNSFVYSLQARGKQIDNDDHLKIRHEIDKLRAIEDKLSKVVSYITRYNALLNSSDPEIRKLVDVGKINVDLLHQLNGKYDELKKKHVKKTYGIMSITDAINKVLSAADRVDGKLDAIMECIGPMCEKTQRKKQAAEEEMAAEHGFKYEPARYLNPYGSDGSARTSQSGSQRSTIRPTNERGVSPNTAARQEPELAAAAAEAARVAAFGR